MFSPLILCLKLYTPKICGSTWTLRMLSRQKIHRQKKKTKFMDKNNLQGLPAIRSIRRGHVRKVNSEQSDKEIELESEGTDWGF